MTVQEAKNFFNKYILRVKTVPELNEAMRKVIKERAVLVAPLLAKMKEVYSQDGGAQQDRTRQQQPMQQRNNRVAPQTRQSNQKQSADSLFAIPMPPKQNVAERQNAKVPLSLEKMMDMMQKVN